MKLILKRILVVAVVLIFAAVCTAAIYQQIATWQDSRRFPQQGKSIALGTEFPTVSLNMDCSGSGSPTVILESGLGVPALGWYQVQPEIAKFTRVCSYDRAGYGWSTPGPMPRTSDQVINELHALLRKSGEKGPYVLVAHSLGGFYARIYTARYPGEVAGLVLVDTSHEDQVSRMPPGLQKLMADQNENLRKETQLAPWLIHTGFARLTSSLEAPASLSLEKRREFRYLELQTKYVDATASEMALFEDSAARVRKAGDLGNRPLIVLSAGKAAEEGLPKSVSKKEMSEFQQTWIHDLQVREAHLSTQGKQIVVEDSDHMIPIERPQPIIDATREVIEAIRAAMNSSNPASH